MPNEPEPALERTIDGYWGVSGFLNELRRKVEAVLRDGKTAEIRVFIGERKT